MTDNFSVDSYGRDAVVWDLRNPSASCPAVADYPEGVVQGAAAFVYKDRPMSCAGYLGANVDFKECYSYDVEAGEWRFEAVTKYAFRRMAGVDVQGDWWLIGGG